MTRVISFVQTMIKTIVLISKSESKVVTNNNINLEVESYLRVVNICNPASISRKMFVSSKDLLDKMLLVFNEFQQSNCDMLRLCNSKVSSFGFKNSMCRALARFFNLDFYVGKICSVVK